MSKIIEKTEFIYQFLNKPKTVGAIMPSSKYLSKKIISFVDFNKEGLVLLDYGAGTGPFTSEMIKYIKPVFISPRVLAPSIFLSSFANISWSSNVTLQSI